MYLRCLYLFIFIAVKLEKRERYSVVDSASSGALHNDDPFAAFRPWELTMNAMEEENGLHLL